MANVLVVDDLKDITDTVKMLLEEEGHKVDTANSSSTAKTLLEKSHYDVMMTDILMPEESGISLIQDINNNSDTYNRPLSIIAMSGGGPTMDPSVALEAASIKTDFQMKKPFTKEKLVFALQIVLDKNRSSET